MRITMPVVAVSSMFFHEYSCREIFSFVLEAGFDGMEFWIETPDFWLRNCPVDEIVSLRKTSVKTPGFTVHAPVLDLNPCSINPGVASLSIDYALRSVRLAERLGADIVTLHPGRRTTRRPPSKADLQRFSHYIATLREEAGRRPNIRIAMENMEPKVNSLLCTPERARELLDEEPWLSFTLDVAHALSGEAGDLGRYVQLCKDRLVNVHLSRKNGNILHFPLDKSPAMAEVVALLSRAGYTGPLTLEIDDLNFPRRLSAEEKIAVLRADRAFIMSTIP